MLPYKRIHAFQHRRVQKVDVSFSNHIFVKLQIKPQQAFNNCRKYMYRGIRKSRR